MWGRIIGLLIFISIYFAFEYYVFSGLKALFKNGQMPKVYKIAYWSIVLIPIIWMFANPLLGNNELLKWFRNIMIGVSVAFLVTKLAYAIFLAVEDFYRIFRFGIDNTIATVKKKTEWIPMESRRRFVTQIALGIASLPFVSFIYGVFRGRYAYTLHEHTLTFKDLPKAFDGLRIVQISDVHSGSFDDFHSVKRGLELIQAQNADLILFTGDLVNSRATEIEPYVELFAKLSAPMGKFSVLGNHDYADYVRWGSVEAEEANMQRLFKNQENMGFRLLNNESLLLEKDGESLRLAGVENWGTGGFPQKGDLDKTFLDTPENEFTILMSHDPSHWDAKVRDFSKHIHLMLSGHTHGFQLGIEIPGFKWSPVKYRYPQWAGLYEDEKGQRLYVNRGFGFLGYPGRVGILPEITVFELKCA